MDHADTEVKGILRRTDGNGLFVNENLSLIGIVDAREHIHKRCLAAAVFTEQSKHLAAVDIEPDFVVCQNGAETLRYITHFYGWGSFFHCAFSFLHK